VIQIAIRVTLPDGRYATVRADVCEDELATRHGMDALRARLDARLARVIESLRECLPGGWMCREPAIEGVPFGDADSGKGNR